MPTLYVTEPGARIEKEYRRILVASRDEVVLLSVPLVHVTDVVIVGSAGVTTQAMLSLLDEGVSFSIISASGKLRGRLLPPSEGNIFLRRRQYLRAADPAFCLPIAKGIALGKLKNQRAFARRLCRSHKDLQDSAINNITTAIKSVEISQDMDTLRGQEGQGAKAYFRIFRAALNSNWSFEKRSRRPPADPTNALLSFGYGLLTQNIMTALELVGLDPYDGIFHADVYGRPALALDLMEEFRALIVDSVVLTVVNKRILSPDDFDFNLDRGFILKQPAMKKFLLHYNARLQTSAFHPLAKRAITYQKAFEVQAWQLRRVIEGKIDSYQAYLTK